MTINQDSTEKMSTNKYIISWLLVCVTVDLLFLPMFHIGRIPYKITYFLLIPYLPNIIATTSKFHYTMLMIAISALNILGTMTYWIYNGFVFNFNPSCTFTLCWILYAAGFSLGYSESKKSISFVQYAIVAFFLINLIIWFYYDSLPAIVNFYNLQDRVNANLMENRMMGIHYNPNVTSRAVLLMILFWSIWNIRSSQWKNKTIRIIIIFSFSWATVIMLQSRSAIICMGLLTIVFFARIVASPKFIIGIIILICSIIAIKFTVQNNDLIKSRIESTFTVWRSFKNMFNIDLDSESLYTDINNHNILRPVKKLEIALDRFYYSPIWGTGREEGKQYPFNEATYHNDALFFLASFGLIGFLLYIILILFSIKMNKLTLILFLSGLSNAFTVLPSHFLYFSIMIGYFYGQDEFLTSQPIEVKNLKMSS